jgi:hypothetical protein
MARVVRARIQTVCCATALALAAGCGDSPDALRQHVATWCARNASALAHARDGAARGERYAVGVGTFGDGEASLTLYREFLFCAEARRAADDDVSEVETQFDIAAKDFREHSGDADEITASLANMAALYARVNAWPMR